MTKAAENGDPQAAFNLGWCYYIGNGVASNKAEAWKWYDKAAGLGVREAAEIRRILEGEAQRNQDLRTLKEIVLSPRRYPIRLLLSICAVLAIIGVIAAVAHIVEGQYDVRNAEAVAGEDTTGEGEAVHAESQLSGRPEKQAVLEREEATSDDAQSASVGEHGPDAPLEEHGNANAVTVVESAIPSSAPLPSTSSLIDFNDWAERARRWLEDGDDLQGPGTDNRDASEERRHE